MNIRSITCFVPLTRPAADLVAAPAALVRAAREAFAAGGYTVQTTRLAVPPLHTWSDSLPPVQAARTFERLALNAGFDYGALLVAQPELYDAAASMVEETTALFVSLAIASRSGGVNLAAVRAAAATIHRLAHAGQDGLANFRFAAAANVPPGIPFFPVAYADSSPPTSSFALATEAADLAVDAFTGAANLEDARTRLVAAIETHGARLAEIGQALERTYSVRFAGIDFSLAPFPEENRSLATALERLTGARFGTRGTLFAASYVTDCLRAAQFRRTGFSGLMLPLLEDWTMAQRSQADLYSLDSLLLYSTVCGTGLDTVPLAGDTTPDALAALLLDLAALAVKLDKPLTARLIPVPGLRPGELTRFDFPYMTNARALAINNDASFRII